MNKRMIVQLIIIGVAIFCGYQAVSNLLNSFIYFVIAFKINEIPAPWEYFTSYILNAVTYTAFFLFLVRKNRKLADNILKNDDEAGNFSGINITGRVVIYSLLLSFTLYGILENIPFVFRYCFNWFRFKIGSNQDLEGMLTTQKENFITTLMYMLILVIVLYYLNPITAYFYQKLEGYPIQENNKEETQQPETNN
jgi:hypothetical protein